MNRFLRLLLLGATLTLPVMAVAQPPSPGGDDTVTRGTKIDPNDPKPDTGKEQPILAYFMALLATAGILFIVCSPARKQ